MNSKQLAIIGKDIRALLSNSRLLSVMLIVPIMICVLMPLGFTLAILLAPLASSDLAQLIALLPADMIGDDVRWGLLAYVVNSVLPMFFLLTPIMASSVMAASSFIGEKEKRTLETLLYSPLSLRQVFVAKVGAAFFVSMAVSLLSFVLMILVIEVAVLLVLGSPLLPGLSWLILMVLVAPALSLIAITLIVRGSAKARSSEESQQRSVFLILPIMLLIAGQMTGLVLVSPLVLFLLGLLLAAVAWLVLRGALGKFGYDTLLQNNT